MKDINIGKEVFGMMRIIRRSPDVVDLDKRYGMLAFHWLTRSPYAQFKLQLDQLDTDWRRKLWELMMQYEQKIRSMQTADYNARLELHRQFLNELYALRDEFMRKLQEVAPDAQTAQQLASYADVQVKRVEERVSKNLVKDVDMAAAELAASVPEKPTQPSRPSGGGSVSRATRPSGIPVPSKETIKKQEEIAKKSPSQATYFPETGTLYVKDKSGNVYGYSVAPEHAASMAQQAGASLGGYSGIYSVVSSKPTTAKSTTSEPSEPASTSTGGGGNIFSSVASTISNTVSSLFGWLR